MSKILVASTPLLGHVSPMLAIASSLQESGHAVLFHTGDAFRRRIADRGIAFTSQQGYANYDWKNLSALLTPEEAGARGLEGYIVHLKPLFADAIPDKYRSLEEAQRTHDADLIVIDVLYMGILPLLLKSNEHPPVISCGVLAPMWRDAGFSPFHGADSLPKGRQGISRTAFSCRDRSPLFFCCETRSVSNITYIRSSRPARDVSCQISLIRHSSFAARTAVLSSPADKLRSSVSFNNVWLCGFRSKPIGTIRALRKDPCLPSATGLTIQFQRRRCRSVTVKGLVKK
jgi:hypothetical protein